MQIYAESSDLTNVFSTNLLNNIRKNKAKTNEKTTQIGSSKDIFQYFL